MTKDKDGKVSELPSGDSEYTKITFVPDLEKFKMKKLDDDIVSLMARRAYDVAGTTGIKVYLNGSLVPVVIFLNFLNYFLVYRFPTVRRAVHQAQS